MPVEARPADITMVYCPHCKFFYGALTPTSFPRGRKQMDVTCRNYPLCGKVFTVALREK